MSVIGNLKGIKKIYYRGKEIKYGHINGEMVFFKDGINPTYNYFVFDTSKYPGLGQVTVTLANYRAKDWTEWDRMTDWGDGTIDTKYSHTYETTGIYTVKTKWMICNNKSGTSSVDESVRYTLVGCKNININVRDVTSLFRMCQNLEYVDMSNFRTNEITSMHGMFYGCIRLKELNITGWNTSNVTDMNTMFYNCKQLTPKVGHFDVSSVTDMYGMFNNCQNLDGSQFKNWKPIKIDNLGFMFSYAVITSGMLDLSGWNVSSANSFASMFYGCIAYEKINISGWSVKSDASLSSIFYNTRCDNYCKDLEHHVIHNNVPKATWERMKQGY